MGKRFLSLALCLCLLLAASVPAYALEEDAPEMAELRISSVDDFLAFAEKCRLDSYSQNLTVLLEADLDLSGMQFAGIPSFSGIFEGGGHTVSGLNFTSDGSAKGFFRYLTMTAVVRNFQVRGTLSPGGSRSEIGGIAGSNAGKIENCSFDGTVSGRDSIGGLVGVNTLTGVIESCQVGGRVYGIHFVGGIAGKNSGVLRSCTSSAVINSTPQQNTVELSDVTMESLLHSESVNTVTDIGGIAGSSTGVIRDCANLGSVGYQHMGYNIGGIVGTQSGYVMNCENQGRILGRKEVGGIAGQMEPAALVEYDEDALQILQEQLETMSAITNKTAANVQSASDALHTQISGLEGHIQDAKDAVETLLPDPENPGLPDLDTIQAAQNSLSSSMSGMTQSLQGMSATTQSAIGTLSNNLYALQNQINAMSATLGSVSETLGGSITDVSDADTAEMLTGKVQDCVNRGEVLGDLNIGGITGAMAPENDLDPMEDWTIEGTNSLNFQSELRCVILNCENNGGITAIKTNAGGIVGWQSMGLVKSCRSSGDLNAEDADYVGGISGLSTGFIRASSAKSLLWGRSYVGGIAGSATIVTDCRAMAELEGSERLGAVLGLRADSRTDEESPVSGNFYLTVSRDFGGIDGISYDGLAQPLSEPAFFALEDLPALFREAAVTFLFADGTQTRIAVPAGGGLSPAQIPAVPEKAGFEGQWEGLAEANLSNILFNLTFKAKYTAHNAALQSNAVREKGQPVLLVQGDFPSEATLTLSSLGDAPKLEGRETLLETWAVTISAPEQVTAARWRLPEGSDPSRISVYLRDGAENWRMVEHTTDGSYAVFPLTGGDSAIAMVQSDKDFTLFLVAGGIAALILTLTCLLIWWKKKPGKGKTQRI